MARIIVRRLLLPGVEADLRDLLNNIKRLRFKVQREILPVHSRIFHPFWLTFTVLCQGTHPR